MTFFVIAYLLLSTFIFFKVARGYYLKTSGIDWAQGLKNKQNSAYLLSISLGLLAFVIPFYRVSTSIPTIILVLMLFLYYIQHVSWKEFVKYVKNNHWKYWFLLIGYFVYILMHSILLNGDFNKLSLELIPIVYLAAFALLENFNKQALKWVAHCFMLGSLLFIPFITGIACFRFEELSWDSFFYTDLLDPVKANPITHALYYNIALVLAAQFLKATKSAKMKTIYSLAMVGYFCMIILFGSKIGYLTVMCSVFFLGITFLPKRIYKLTFLIVTPLAIYLLFEQVPYVNKKIKGFKWQLSRHELISLDNRLPRSVIWPEAIALIKEKPITGYGYGRGYESLVANYETIGYTKGIDNRFNAHNQFLESFLQIGILGLLWWLVALVYLIAVAIKKKDPWLAIFLFLSVAYLSVESLMESQMGVIGYSFFLAYFLLQTVDSKATSHKT